MRRVVYWHAAAFALFAFPPLSRAEVKATLVFANGRVFTAPSGGKDEAPTTLAIDHDRIVYLGDVAGVRRFRGPGTRWIDLQGRTVLPGLVDAHGHLNNLGKLLRTVSLIGTESAQEVAALAANACSRAGEGDWIYGRGWDQNDWAEKSFPHWRQLSDTESNPVYLSRVDGHALWVNRTALELCGITAQTPDPPGGKIIRDAHGAPTGILIDNAQDLVLKRVPEPSPQEIDARLSAAMRECNRVGLVGVHDAGTTRAVLEALRRLGKRGELTINVYAMLDSDEPDLLREFFARGPSREFDGRLVERAVKLRADGALGSRGAALLEPYRDDPDNRGLDVTPPDTIRYWVGEAVRHGFQVATHAIGDRANRATLDAYQSALEENGARDARLRVEHCQVLTLDDIPRFAALGVVASMQPTHATSDMPWAEALVGAERLRGAYAWRSLLASGAVLAFGSDFPVESVDPLQGLYAAVTRQDMDGDPAGGWRAEEALTLAEAVAAFTQGAAYASFDESGAGTIAVGRRADLTILDRRLSSDPRELLRTRVAFTVVRGVIVYESRD